MIHQSVINFLKGKKNLLAFSYGVDSTALFYILLENGIEFDIAIVNYNTRSSSKDEESQAKKLAFKFNKTCFYKSVKLGGGNFESKARQIRYDFFYKICKENGYENLILAHQLNDLFEWFLMQFGRGSGLNELIGMQEIEKNGDICLVRPLLKISKSKLLAYLQNRNLKYFIDESNFSDKFFRNYIRKNFSDSFLARFEGGVAKSFEFLNSDLQILKPTILYIQDEFYLVKHDKNAVRGVDRVCKILGIVMSEAQRKICIGNCVISGKIAIGLKDDWIFVTPFVNDKMDKKFKESCRINRIPNLNRPYLFTINFDFQKLSSKI